MSPVKDLLVTAVDGLADELEALSHRIHAHPELCYQEVKAHAWLTDFLEAKGARVERGVGGVPTAFRAIIGSVWLNEGRLGSRLTGAGVVLLGVACVALAR